MTDPNNDSSDRRVEHEGATEFEEFLEEGAEALSSGSADAETDDEILDALEPESEVDILTREVNQFKDTALRLQADFENYRKRVTAQQADEIDRAAGKIVESLRPVLDAGEAAFSHGAEGVEPIWSQLMGVLQKQGLEALDL